MQIPDLNLYSDTLNSFRTLGLMAGHLAQYPDTEILLQDVCILAQVYGW